MMMPANGHRIQGMTSEKFLDSKEFLDELNLTGSENFMDAGCGDGHVAIKALEEYITDGCVYAWICMNLLLKICLNTNRKTMQIT